MCTLNELRNGTYDIYDFLDFHEALDLKEHCYEMNMRNADKKNKVGSNNKSGGGGVAISFKTGEERNG